MLFAAREGDVRRFDGAGVPSIMLGGLEAEAAAALFARGVGGDAAPLVRDRLTELAGWNALALLELPSALTEAQLAGIEPHARNPASDVSRSRASFLSASGGCRTSRTTLSRRCRGRHREPQLSSPCCGSGGVPRTG